MTDEGYKEVDFEKYCKLCKYKDVDEVKDPCNECLGEPGRIGTEKPVSFKEKE